MEIHDFIANTHDTPVKFADVIAFIDSHYDATPTAFTNGNKENLKEENQGSAKLLYFAKVNHLTVDETLHLFGEHYQHVLSDPHGDNHQNIRQFKEHGWEGLKFDDVVLSIK